MNGKTEADEGCARSHALLGDGAVSALPASLLGAQPLLYSLGKQPQTESKGQWGRGTVYVPSDWCQGPQWEAGVAWYILNVDHVSLNTVIAGTVELPLALGLFSVIVAVY